MENRIVRWVLANRVSNRGSRIEIRLSILIVAALTAKSLPQTEFVSKVIKGDPRSLIIRYCSH